MIDPSPLVQKWDKSGLEGGRFINSKVREDILTNMKTCVSYRWIFDGVKIHMCILYSRNDPKHTKFLVLIINLVIYILNKRQKSVPQLDILLICSSIKKIKPVEGGALTSENVNTGYTSGGCDIVVYRKEEMIKVLIHELVHAYNHHQRSITTNDEALLNSYFHVTSITMNESFTDGYACLLNTALFTLFQKSKTSKNVKDLFHLNFQNEQKIILRQSLNILVYNKYTIHPRRISMDVVTEAVNEETHVISYYVLKAILFSNIDGFINYLDTHNCFLDNSIEYVQLILNNLPYYSLLMYNDLDKFRPFNSLKMTHLDIKENYLRTIQNV